MRIKSVTIEGMHNVAEKTYRFNKLGYLYGKNGAGKSTALQAIQLALLGYIPGQNKTNAAIFRHARNKTITVTLSIDNNGEDITIVRTWVSSGSSVSASVNVTPPIYKPEELIGELELPIFNFNQFCSMTANQLKDWFIDFLPSADGDIDWKAKLEEALGDKKVIDEGLLDDTLNRINMMSNTAKGVELVRAVNDYLKEQVSFKKGEVERIESTVKSLIFHEDVGEDIDVDELHNQMALLNKVNSELASYNAQLAANASITNALAEIELSADNLEDDEAYVNANLEIEKLKEEAAKLRSEAEEIKGIVAKIRKEEQAIREGAKQYLDEWRELSSQLTQIEADIRAKSQIIESEGICPYTNVACDSIKAFRETLKSEVADLNEKKEKISADMASVKAKHDADIEKCGEKQKEADSILRESTAKLDEAYLIDSKISRTTGYINELQAKYVRRSELQRQLDAACLTIVPPTSKTSEELLAEMNVIHDQIVKVEANKKYNELADNLTAQKFKIDNSIEVLKLWIKLTDANGLQTAMMTEPFKDLAAEMDSFLHMMFGNTEIATNFNLSEKANSFSFGLNKEGKYVPFDLLSSGEKCLYALAMMMCLVAKSDSPLKVILIDDILDHLDDENAQAMFESLYNVQGIQFILAGVQKCSFENAPEIIIEVK